MKKLSKKGILLFAAAMALCAFAMPSMASAASWGAINSEHTLDSPDVGFESHGALGTIRSNCTSSRFTFTVNTAADATVTAASFGGLCTATGAAVGSCTVTTSATNLPWTATAVTTSNIQLHGVDIDITFEAPPSGVCNNLAGQRLKITGTLTGGFWTGNSANQHEIILDNEDGLVSHNPILGNNGVITARGTFRDTQQTLTVS